MKPTNLPFHPPFYYGWVILFIAALSMFFSGPGQTYSISIFIDYYIEDFDLSRSLVSTLYLFATLLSGFLLFTMGRAIERFGPRRMSVVIAVMLGLACLWNSFLTGAVMMFIGFFTLRFFGQGSMMLLPNTVVPQWFAGFLNEKVKVHYVVAAMFLGQIIVMLLLVFTHSFATAMLFAVVRGIVQGFEGVSLNLVWPNYYGKKAIGSIKSIVLSVMVVGSAFGPLPFAIAYDQIGQYTEIILWLALFPLLAMICALISPPPRRRSRQN